jgi:hypothetical protein
VSIWHHESYNQYNDPNPNCYIGIAFKHGNVGAATEASFFVNTGNVNLIAGKFSF